MHDMVISLFVPFPCIVGEEEEEEEKGYALLSM